MPFRQAELRERHPKNLAFKSSSLQGMTFLSVELARQQQKKHTMKATLCTMFQRKSAGLRKANLFLKKTAVRLVFTLILSQNPLL